MKRSVWAGVLTAAAVAAACLAVAVAFPHGAYSDGPPPGATALCRDGTYSYSQHHSGTCSHHGGVAQWLDGGTTAPPAAPTTTAAAPPPPPATTAPAPTPTTTPASATVPVTAAPTPASAATTPSGATARCTDGTYSFAIHHQGACSHHGGVARWLDGTTGTSKAPSTKAGATGAKTARGAISLGRIVFIHKRTKTTGCHLGSDPDRRCSPGAYYSGLTKKILCSPSFHTGSIRDVAESERHQVEIEYGLTPKGYGRTMEIDHIVSLELGGSNDIANLFPEKANPAPGYHVKDKLENETHRWVCSGKISLHAAQVAIATNWQQLYKRVFGVSPS